MVIAGSGKIRHRAPSTAAARLETTPARLSRPLPLPLPERCVQRGQDFRLQHRRHIEAQRDLELGARPHGQKGRRDPAGIGKPERLRPVNPRHPHRTGLEQTRGAKAACQRQRRGSPAQLPSTHLTGGPCLDPAAQRRREPGTTPGDFQLRPGRRTVGGEELECASQGQPKLAFHRRRLDFTP